MSWLDDWWEGVRVTPPEEPKELASWHTSDGTPLEVPFFPLVSARERIPKVINLQRLKEQVWDLLLKGR